MSASSASSRSATRCGRSSRFFSRQAWIRRSSSTGIGCAATAETRGGTSFSTLLDSSRSSAVSNSYLPESMKNATAPTA